jgi:heat shock protein HslJ
LPQALRVITSMQKIKHLFWLFLPLLTGILVSSVFGSDTVEAYRGFYVFSAEARTFQPCGSEKVYWVRASEAISNRLRSEHQRLTAKPYEAIYVEVKGRLLAKAAEGFAADYDGQIVIETIVSIRPSRKEDCRIAPEDGDDIIGVIWRWRETAYKADAKAFPDDPSLYTVVFDDGGNLRIRADCNRAGGTYALHNSALTIVVTHSTRAMCAPESLEQSFLKDLNAAADFLLWDGNLYIRLKNDTGTMKFSR